LSETSLKFEATKYVYTAGVGETSCRQRTRVCPQTVSWRNWSLFNQSLIRQTFCRPLRRRAVAAVRFYRYSGRSVNT